MPQEGRILVTDIGMPPVAVFNIPALLIERMKNWGVEGNKSFKDWNEAVKYGETMLSKKQVGVLNTTTDGGEKWRKCLIGNFQEN